MNKIFVSACLLGNKVRYDGKIRSLPDPWFKALDDQGILVSFCPEVDAGMNIPRPPAQIIGGTGIDVLSGQAKVVNTNGIDVTDYFIKGAESALKIVKELNIKVAVLKDKSPSCGKNRIYDGTFSSTLAPGSGVTAAKLLENGVKIFSETEINTLKLFLKQNKFK